MFILNKLFNQKTGVLQEDLALLNFKEMKGFI
ncbi:hypothetical protein DFP98_10267 [Cohnella phaseoli]|uniref:Uncharacterized protein n=1 Tax=Cohnella phaseoli TaxID=456490 RepID=A0A3D9KM84_9BACL|nr:hypothetical protein DFP98_10267 [Cohnella phaseoli]